MAGVNMSSLLDLMTLRRLPQDGSGVRLDNLVEAVYQDEIKGTNLYRHWRPAHRITEDRIRALIKGKLIGEAVRAGHPVVTLTPAGKERLQYCGPALQERLSEIPSQVLTS
jgi:hypothetical protein